MSWKAQEKNIISNILNLVMALEATHIRFALSLKKDFEVVDEEQYILGASYPDTRYLTGIERDLTHGKNVLRKDFATTDFKKGWQTHELCDQIQCRAFRKCFPFLDKYGKDWTDEKWINFTALKVVQDMLDRQKIDTKFYIKYLENIETPNGENVEKIKKFNKMLMDLYNDDLDIKKYTSVVMGKKENIIEVMKKAESYLKEDKILDQFPKVFQYMVESYKEFLT